MVERKRPRLPPFGAVQIIDFWRTKILFRVSAVAIVVTFFSLIATVFVSVVSANFAKANQAQAFQRLLVTISPQAGFYLTASNTFRVIQLLQECVDVVDVFCRKLV